MVRVDDAVRAGVLHHVAGGVTAALLLLAVEVIDAGLEPHHVPFGLRLWIPLVLVVLAIVAWRWSGYRAWRVRRAHPDRRAAAPAP